jgi:XRE family transcriptional regulator, master regulator for biofilm formation
MIINGVWDVLGNTIYENRKKKGLTLSELAARAKISKSYLSNIERNINRNPSIQVVSSIADVLNIELDVLLSTKNNNVSLQNLDDDVIQLATELKESGIEREQINEYKTLIEFIKWQKTNDNFKKL